jgi:hypothetical protein
VVLQDSYREHNNNGTCIKCRKLLDELSYYQMLNALNLLKIGLPDVLFAPSASSFSAQGFPY